MPFSSDFLISMPKLSVYTCMRLKLLYLTTFHFKEMGQLEFQKLWDIKWLIWINSDDRYIVIWCSSAYFCPFNRQHAWAGIRAWNLHSLFCSRRLHKACHYTEFFIFTFKLSTSILQGLMSIKVKKKQPYKIFSLFKHAWVFSLQMLL